MSLEDNKALARRYQSAWEHGNLTSLRAMLTDDALNHNPVTGEVRDAVEFELAACKVWHDSFSEVQVQIQHIVAEGDHVTVYWLLTSLHDRDFLGIPPTNKRIRVPGMEIVRIADSRIAEVWRVTDSTGMMETLRSH